MERSHPASFSSCARTRPENVNPIPTINGMSNRRNIRQPPKLPTSNWNANLLIIAGRSLLRRFSRLSHLPLQLRRAPESQSYDGKETRSHRIHLSLIETREQHLRAFQYER